MSSHGGHEHGARSREPTFQRSRSNVKRTENKTAKREEKDQEGELQSVESEKTEEPEGRERTLTPQPEENAGAVESDKEDEETRREENEPTEDRPGSAGAASYQGDDEREDGGPNSFSQAPQPAAVEPDQFDSKSFLGDLSDISRLLQSDQYRTIDSDFPSGELNSMVSNVTTTLNNYKNYSMHSQRQLEGVRGQMKEIRDRMHKRIQQSSFDAKHANQKMSYEERELQNKLAQLNKEVAKAAEDLARAAQITCETEEAAVEASIVAEQAASEAKRIQEEYEARKKAEEEARKAEQERKQAEEARREEEARRAEEEQRLEAERRSRLRKEENKAPAWEKWPTYSYNIEAGEFDQGVGCIIRGSPGGFNDADVVLENVDPLQSTFTCAENEELVGNIIRLCGRNDDDLKSPIYVALPHCITRAAAMSREPVLKAEKGDQWVELKSQEVTFEDHKDLKFVQAEVSAYTTLAVVTRYKRDFLVIPKRGGKLPSNVDHRVTFTAERETFRKPEHFVMQLQPVDSVSLAEIKNKRAEGKGLLNCSAIVTMEWTAKHFNNPILMTLPVPPNPVKARKAAAARAAKEAKMKNPQRNVLAEMEKQERDDERKRKRVEKKPVAAAAATVTDEDKPKEVTKWYMGQYGNNDEDENDLLYLVKKEGSKWHTMEYMKVHAVKLDLVAFELHEPINKFMVIRTRTNVEPREAQQMATALSNYLVQRLANVVVKQRSDDPNEVIVHIVPHNKTERTLRKLVEEGWEEGPGASTDVILRESDVLELDFRGNLRCDGDVSKLTTVYNSNVKTCLTCKVVEVDRFLQRSYQVYRGFLQVFKRIKRERKPMKEEIEKGSDPNEVIIEYQRELVTEVLLSLPKRDTDQYGDPIVSEPITKAPVKIKNWIDPINEETLRTIAVDLGDEWQRVATHLNVKRMRIQAILRNTAHSERREEDAAYDMLLTWAKRVPRGMNKSSILINALGRSGRDDLALEVHHMEKDFRSRRSKSAEPVA